MYEHKKMSKILSSAGIVLFAIIIIGTAAGSIVLEGGIINVSHAQVLQRSPSTGSEVTTPEANPTCDLTDRHVNTRESHVCGIPKTPSATGATTEPITTESPSSITSPPSGTSEAPIPGLFPISSNNTQ
jgi:hypothetical protein